MGDCWFLAAVVAISENTYLFEVVYLYSIYYQYISYFLNQYQAVVPQDQTFGDGYTGAFLFRFWRYGKIVEV